MMTLAESEKTPERSPESAQLDEAGGDIEIDYALEVDHAVAGRNSFRINVKEAEGASLKQ